MMVPLILLALASPPWSLPSDLWGFDGHRIVCAIAFREANANTQARIRTLVASEPGNQSFADTCIWADDARRRANAGESAFQRFARFNNAHFVNFARDAVTITAQGCTRVVGTERQPCVIDAITDFSNVLRTSTNQRERLEALKFLAHFVGDIHQPLHAGYGEDRGGTRAVVVLPNGSESDLHAVWDETLIKGAGKPWQSYAQELRADINPIDRAAWNVLDPVLWARESYQLVEDDVYEDRAAGSGGKPLIDRNYHVLNRLNVERRLKQAGVRLARMLERALGTGIADRGSGIEERTWNTGIAGRGSGIEERIRNTGIADRGSGIGERTWNTGIADRGSGIEERIRNTGIADRGSGIEERIHVSGTANGITQDAR